MLKMFKFVFAALLVSQAAMASGTEKPYINTEVNTSRGSFTDVAIGGYDPVAYFTQSEAVLGNSQFNYDHEDAIWYFASAENRDLFAANPDRYTPQFGGYCAYAVAQGSTAAIDPDQFTIYNDKLYLNLNRQINQRWRANIDEYIRLGEANWPDVLGK